MQVPVLVSSVVHEHDHPVDLVVHVDREQAQPVVQLAQVELAELVQVQAQQEQPVALVYQSYQVQA